MTFLYLFYKFSTPLLIFQIENSDNHQKELYILQKSYFIENNITDSMTLSETPKKKIHSSDELKSILQKYNIDPNSKLAVLDINGELVQYFDLSSLEKEYFYRENIQSTSQALSNKNTNKKKDTIIFSKQFSNKINDIIIQNKLMTASIETIFLPLCSISLQATLIFANKTWKNYQIQYPELSNYQQMFDNTQNIIANQIISSGNIKFKFLLNFSIPLFLVFCSPIKENTRNKNGKLWGYLYWLENKKPSYNKNNQSNINYSDFFSREKYYLKNYMEDEEKKIILWSIKESNKNLKHAASLLKISKKSLSNKIKKYGISLDL